MEFQQRINKFGTGLTETNYTELICNHYIFPNAVHIIYALKLKAYKPTPTYLFEKGGSSLVSYHLRVTLMYICNCDNYLKLCNMSIATTFCTSDDLK